MPCSASTAAAAASPPSAASQKSAASREQNAPIFPGLTGNIREKNRDPVSLTTIRLSDPMLRRQKARRSAGYPGIFDRFLTPRSEGLAHARSSAEDTMARVSGPPGTAARHRG